MCALGAADGGWAVKGKEELKAEGLSEIYLHTSKQEKKWPIFERKIPEEFLREMNLHSFRKYSRKENCKFRITSTFEVPRVGSFTMLLQC